MAKNRIILFLSLLLVLQVVRSTEEENSGTKWAVLVAGSNGFENYRHQADVCHAYQILKKGGLKDENIIVFMYDDIASDEMNPRPGVIINHPDGEDVYAGVPKDYTGGNATVDNLFAVILGDKKAVKGGSGKVVNSGKNDRIFIYYSDHGGPGVLGFLGGFIFAKDFVDVLKKKHKSGTYKEMVLYIEACESGSIFQGLLPKNLNIYVTTASNAEENSFAAYCEYKDYPCIGDLYSVAWMEDSESHNLRKESLAQQYAKVKERSSNNQTYQYGSHVMEYGNKSIHDEKISLYQGFNPTTKNNLPNNITAPARMDVVEQRSADVYFLWKRYNMETRPAEKEKLLKQVKSIENQRHHLDGSIGFIGSFLFGPKSSSVLNGVRQPGEAALVDDWECLKSSVKVFEKRCGSLTQYGMKHMRAFANICNAGIGPKVLEKACEVACDGNNPRQ